MSYAQWFMCTTWILYTWILYESMKYFFNNLLIVGNTKIMIKSIINHKYVMKTIEI